MHVKRPVGAYLSPSPHPRRPGQRPGATTINDCLPVEPPRSPLLREVDRWFEEQGVPQFAHNYSPRDRGAFLDTALFMLIAYQVAFVPWAALFDYEVNLKKILLAPIAIIGCACILWPVVRSLSHSDKRRRSSTRARVIWLILVALLPWLLYQTRLPWFWNMPWVNFTTICCCLLAARLLAVGPTWQVQSASAERLRIGLTITVVAALVGSMWTGVHNIGRGFALFDNFAVVLAVDALPGLVVSVAILYLAVRLTKETQAAGSRVQSEVYPAGIAPVPLLVIVFALDWTVFRYSHGDSTIRALMLTTAISVVLASTATTWQISPPIFTWLGQSFTPPILYGRPGLLLWFSFYLVSVPILAGSLEDVRLYEGVIPSSAVPFLTIFVNACYLLLLWFLVGVGAEVMTAWALKTLTHCFQHMISTLVRGLPLLLVFTVFFLLTAEVWQAAYNLSQQGFISACSLLLTGAVVVLVAT